MLNILIATLKAFYKNWVALFQVVIEYGSCEGYLRVPDLYLRLVIEHDVTERVQQHVVVRVRLELRGVQLLSVPAYEA